MDEQLLLGTGEVLAETRRQRAPLETVDVDEVVNDGDRLRELKIPPGIFRQRARYGGNAVALLEAEFGDRTIRRIQSDQASIGAVQGSDDAERARAKLPRQVGGDGMRDGVMHVQQVDLLLDDHFGQA